MHLLQFNHNCDVEQPTFAFLRVLCPMREQTAPEHPSKAHQRAALARRAFVALTATDDLAIQAEDCIPERENSCVQMFAFSGEHIHQPIAEMWTATLNKNTASFQCVLSKFPVGERTLVPRTIWTTVQRGASLVAGLLATYPIALIDQQPKREMPASVSHRCQSQGRP
jgi:hypothetical protein